MRRWSQIGEMMPYEELEDPTGSLGDGEGDDPSQNSDPNDSQDPQTPTDPQTPFEFTHPSLKGKTEAEIAELMAVKDSALKSQSRRISELEPLATRTQQPAQPEPSDDDDDDDPQEFFKSPGKHTRSIVRDVIAKELKDIVSPLLEDVKSNKVRGNWDAVSSKFSNFETYRPAVEEQLRAWNIPPDAQTTDLIETVFKSKVGEAAMSGDFSPPRSQENGDDPPVNPQHRPSSHPPRSQDAPKKRKLTEEERHMARIQFKGTKDPEAEYLKWTNDEASIDEDGAFILEEEGAE